MSEKLKTCPFCGGEARLFFVTGTAFDWSVECLECRVKVRKRANVSDKSDPARAEAITAWNTRAQSTPAPPEVGGLVERNLDGETVNGVPVLGWMWEVTSPVGLVRTTAYHWSTPPANAKVTRLVDAAALSVRSIPEGWRLVPIEPTEAMLLAAFHDAERHLMDSFSCNTHCKSNEERSAHAVRPLYAAMLAAAPLPAQQEQG